MEFFMKETIFQVISVILEYVAEYSIRIVLAGLVLIVGFKFSSYLSKRYPKFKGEKRIPPEAASFIKSAINIVGKIIIIITAIAIVGIPVASVITVLASCGVAIGLAIQGSLSNVASGIIIVFTRPFKINDIITVGGATGVVKSIDLFYTRLVSGDNKEILIPNGQMMNSQIENITAFDYRRIDLVFSAGYECDTETVKKIIMETARSTPNVITEAIGETSEPFVAVNAQADSSVDYLLRVWCRKEYFFTVSCDLKENMMKAFDANNISIPYPQLDLHVVEK